jgi:hypothetical protein
MCLQMMSRRRLSLVCTRFVDSLQGFYDSYNAGVLPIMCKYIVYNTQPVTFDYIGDTMYCC